MMIVIFLLSIVHHYLVKKCGMNYLMSLVHLWSFGAFTGKYTACKHHHSIEVRIKTKGPVLYCCT